VTLTCDARPVTDQGEGQRDDLRQYDKLRGIVSDLDRAYQRLKDLERERDEEIVRLIGDRPPLGQIAATAHFANLSRQRVNSIRQLARARRERPPKS
jgi:hypothetical protein